jgi:hypothetical protein
MKHSKYRNTGILFELLVRQIASDTLANQDSSAVKIIKKYFNSNTQLGRELELYQSVIKEKFSTETKANKFLDAALTARRQLNSSSLRREKYNLIKEIKQNFDSELFFKSRVNNYRELGSVFRLFETELQPAEDVKNRYQLIEHILKSDAPRKQGTLIQEDYGRQDKDTRLLSYKILIDKFNSKYDKLNERQKSLLRKFINNVSDTSSLKEHIISEVPYIKRTLNRKIKSVNDPVLKIKLKEVMKQANRLGKSRTIKDKEIVSLLKLYELITELKNVK